MTANLADEETVALAEELRRLSGAASGQDAVKHALRDEIARRKGINPLRERAARARAKAEELGAPDPNFDMKRFTDEFWGKM